MVPGRYHIVPGRCNTVQIGCHISYGAMKVSHNGASKLSNAARIMRETSLPNAVLPKSTRLTDCRKFSTDGVFVYGRFHRGREMTLVKWSFFVLL